MQTGIGPHGAEETFELYSLGQLSEDLAAPLEEHILVCESCQDRLGQIEGVVRVNALACSELRRESIRPPASKFWRWLWPVPAPVWAPVSAGVLALALLTVIIPADRKADGDVVSEITLRGGRGGAERTNSHAPAGSLLIRIDATEFPGRPSFRVQVANASGRQLSLSSVQARGGQIQFRAPIHLARGHYWVRLYTSEGAADDQSLLREFPLTLD